MKIQVYIQKFGTEHFNINNKATNYFITETKLSVLKPEKLLVMCFAYVSFLAYDRCYATRYNRFDKHYSDKRYFNSLLDPSDTKSLEVILEAVEAAETTNKKRDTKKEHHSPRLGFAPGTK